MLVCTASQNPAKPAQGDGRARNLGVERLLDVGSKELGDEIAHWEGGKQRARGVCALRAALYYPEHIFDARAWDQGQHRSAR